MVVRMDKRGCHLGHHGELNAQPSGLRKAADSVDITKSAPEPVWRVRGQEPCSGGCPTKRSAAQSTARGGPEHRHRQPCWAQGRPWAASAPVGAPVVARTGTGVPCAYGASADRRLSNTATNRKRLPAACGEKNSATLSSSDVEPTAPRRNWRAARCSLPRYSGASRWAIR